MEYDTYVDSIRVADSLKLEWLRNYYDTYKGEVEFIPID
jgi:hypothetical protein